MATGSVRDFLSGAALRAIAKIVDVGAIFIGTAKVPDDDEDGDPWVIDEDKRDVWINCKGTLDGKDFVGRLHVPGNMLYRLPRKDDHLVFLRPGGGPGEGGAGDTPGAGLVLHGDAGAKDRVPTWLTKDKSGLSIPEAMRIESLDDLIEIVAKAAARLISSDSTATVQGKTAVAVTSTHDATTVSAKLKATLRSTDDDVEILAGIAKKIQIGAASGTQPIPAGDDLETRIANIESVIAGLTYTYPLDGVSVAGTAGPYSFTLASAVVGPLTTDPFPSPQDFKSTVAFVKK